MRYFILTFSVLTLSLISSCSNDIKKEEKEKPKEEDTIISFDDIKPMENVTPRLNNSTIVDFLQKYGEENKETIIKIITDFGDIKIRLYDDTPLHRANFIMLINKGIYEDTQFSRVVKGFVIQGGSSDETYAANKKYFLGDYTLPQEMSLKHIHKYGALAMSRDYTGNEDKRSDAFDFYIVIGERISDVSLYQLQKEKGITYSEEQLHLYKTIGGTPHLDMEHTVFGEVISGMEVVKKINGVEVDGLDWPKEQVVINFELIK
jgi:peptidyl-prolyl cis-trans isomerase B (cyclophilin B)